LLWACERTLGVNDPFPRAHGSEVGLECLPVSQRDEIGEELQFASFVCCHETFEEQTPEQAREHPNWQEEVWTASHPAHAVGGDTSAGYNAVDVRVMMETLSPGVQDGGEADVGAEVPGIGGDRRERLSRRLEQQAIDLGLVLVGMAPICAGRVNTTWKYGTGNSSASRASSQACAAIHWHFGQCRFRQEL
jgi:hypothetical protein